MTKQFYQIFSAPRQSSEVDHKPELLAIMPMDVMQNALELHKDAVFRIVRETAENEGRGICSLHFGHRARPGFGHAVVVGRCEQWSAQK